MSQIAMKYNRRNQFRITNPNRNCQCLQLLRCDLGRETILIARFSIQSRRFSATNWRQIWRVAGRESGTPELLGSPQNSPEVPRTSPEVFGDFPGSSLTVELNSNPEVPRKFPRLPRKFPGLPRKFPGLPRRSAPSLGSLTPSPDSQKLSLKV